MLLRRRRAAFGAAAVAAAIAFKSAANGNYLVDWLDVGSVLIGAWLGDLLRAERRFAAVEGFLIVGLRVLPVRQMLDEFPQLELDRQPALARGIAAAIKADASETMTCDAAMRRAYPSVEQASPTLWLHPPPQ